MRMEPVGRNGEHGHELPSPPIHTDAGIFLPNRPLRWVPFLILSALVFYPLLGWAIYTLFW